MQPRPVSPPPGQLTLPIEVTQRPSPTPEAEEAEEAVAGRRAPREVWETVSPAGRDRLRAAWLHVLKGVAGNA
ncbi:MAG: hypothetical protein M3P70_08670 [Actinomycetota bacterium]|jgi:hypothetical protein|nr:hypothetical protein [Actinomycetota bacterium]